MPHLIGNLKKLNGSDLFKFSNIVNHSSFLFSLKLGSNSALPEEFQQNVYYDHTAVQSLISDLSIYYRHEIMRDAARRAALFIIARYGEGDLAVFPRDLIKLIANEVWKTRLDDRWMKAGKELNPSSSKGAIDV